MTAKKSANLTDLPAEKKTRKQKRVELAALKAEVVASEPTQSPILEGDVITKETGRPTTYTPEKGKQLLAYLAMGESLRTACSHENMPAVSTVFYWFDIIPGFSEQYLRAKEEAADAMAEDILDIADDGSNDWMERQFGDTTAWITNGEALQRSRLRVETRKWLMAKMKPKRYGDKLDVTSNGDALPAPLMGVIGQKNPTDDIKELPE